MYKIVKLPSLYITILGELLKEDEKWSIYKIINVESYNHETGEPKNDLELKNIFINQIEKIQICNVHIKFEFDDLEKAKEKFNSIRLKDIMP